MIRWAIIGTGDVSHRLVSDLQAVAPGKITAIWGRTYERARAFADDHGIRNASDSLEHVLARDDVDIVYIATPATTHCDIALRALTAGKHVLVKKPMTTSADDTARIFAKAREVGRFAMEAMWMRFNPLHVEIRERIADGLIGEVNSVRASFGTPFQARGRVLTPAHGGSILLDRGIYPITLAQWFLDEPVALHAAGRFQHGIDVSGHATLEFARGFAQIGTMWECVDLFRVESEQNATDVLVFSAWDDGVTQHPLYWTGDYRGDRFEPKALHRLDLGGRFFYAPQSMKDEAGRRIMFGWMQEGRTDAATVAAGWSGVMSLPRVVSARADGSLHQAPAPEIDALRTDILFDGDASAVTLGALDGDQLDLELDVTLAPGGSVELTVRATPDNQERTTYRLRRFGDEAEFSLDRTRSSLDERTDAQPLSGVIPLEGDVVRLRVLVDRSALEAFANGVPLAARVYPTRSDATHIAIALDDARASLRAWRVTSVR